MAKNSRYMTGQPRRVSIALDSDTLRDLDQIAPDNIGEAVRFCIQHALAAGAVFKATTQHTAAQCRKHQQRYPDNAAPLPTTYGGHVMKVIPAPAPAQVATPAPTQPAAVWTQPEPIQPAPVIINGVTQGTEEEHLLYGDDDDEDEPAQVALQRIEPLEPTVIRGQPLSAAALAAVAAIALTDDEIKALDPARGGALPFVG
jgi:hypothetical protein